MNGLGKPLLIPPPQLQQLKITEEENKAEFQRLQSHQKAIAHKPALAEINMCEKKQIELQNEICKITNQLRELEKALKDVADENIKSVRNHKNAEEELSAALPLFEEVTKKDAELKSLKEQLNKSKEMVELVLGYAQSHSQMSLVFLPRLCDESLTLTYPRV